MISHYYDESDTQVVNYSGEQGKKRQEAIIAALELKKSLQVSKDPNKPSKSTAAAYEASLKATDEKNERVALELLKQDLREEKIIKSQKASAPENNLNYPKILFTLDNWEFHYLTHDILVNVLIFYLDKNSFIELAKINPFYPIPLFQQALFAKVFELVEKIMKSPLVDGYACPLEPFIESDYQTLMGALPSWNQKEYQTIMGFIYQFAPSVFNTYFSTLTSEDLKEVSPLIFKGCFVSMCERNDLLSLKKILPHVDRRVVDYHLIITPGSSRRPCEIAAEKGRSEVLSLLHEKKADMDYGLLTLSCGNAKWQTFEWILDNLGLCGDGYDRRILELTQRIVSAPTRTLTKFINIPLVKKCLSNIENSNEADSALYIAIKGNNIELAQTILKRTYKRSIHLNYPKHDFAGNPHFYDHFYYEHSPITQIVFNPDVAPKTLAWIFRNSQVSNKHPDYYKTAAESYALATTLEEKSHCIARAEIIFCHVEAPDSMDARERHYSRSPFKKAIHDFLPLVTDLEVKYWFCHYLINALIFSLEKDLNRTPQASLFGLYFFSSPIADTLREAKELMTHLKMGETHLREFIATNPSENLELKTLHALIAKPSITSAKVSFS